MITTRRYNTMPTQHVVSLIAQSWTYRHWRRGSHWLLKCITSFCRDECGSKYQACGAWRRTLHFVLLERSWSLKKVQNLKPFSVTSCKMIPILQCPGLVSWQRPSSSLTLKYEWAQYFLLGTSFFTLLLFHQMINVSSPSDDPYILQRYTSFSGAFAKLLKATVSFLMCLSAWNSSAPTGRIFLKFGICVVFENLSRNSKFY